MSKATAKAKARAKALDKEYLASPPETKGAWNYILSGLVLGLFMNVPFYAWIFMPGLQVAEEFPLSWAGVCLTYMATFFHELGHTAAAWFYGYATLPSFDFQHGGGMAWMLSEQEPFIIGTVYLCLAYLMYMLRLARPYQVAVGLVILFNLVTVSNDTHRIVIDFFGPFAEILVASFLLTRAWMNLAPRGGLERFLNALFGFAMIIRVWVDSWGLITNESYRMVYYDQKGMHGFGDFDKIADNIPFMGFEAVVMTWGALAFVGCVVPFIIYLSRDKS